MKTLLTTLIAILLTQSANAKDIANYRFSVQENFEHRDSRITVYSATLTDEKEIKILETISESRYPFFIPRGGVQVQEYTKSINDSVYKFLKDKVIGLSKTKITTKKNLVVCMLMPGPGISNNHLSVLRGYDFQSGSYLGEMELVMGPKGCWVRKSIFPTNNYDLQTAIALKTSIKTLVLDFVGK